MRRSCLAQALLLALVLAGRAVAAQTPPAQDPHAGHQAEAAPADPHAGHHMDAPAAELPPFIPALTDADRAAAFPDVHAHGMNDNAVHSYVLVDQLEWQGASGSNGFSWDTKGWIGHDRSRFWFRSEGDRTGSHTEQAQTNLLYGRSISRWWDVTAGVRLDTLPSTPRAALALGIQGLAPYRFDVEASAFVEPNGRSHVRFETKYDLLVTNRLIMQGLLETEIYTAADRERHIGAGLSTTDIGLRLRYEFRREVAPYVGVVWGRKYFGTADLAQAHGDTASSARLAVGFRTWF